MHTTLTLTKHFQKKYNFCRIQVQCNTYKLWGRCGRGEKTKGTGREKAYKEKINKDFDKRKKTKDKKIGYGRGLDSGQPRHQLLYLSQEAYYR